MYTTVIYTMNNHNYILFSLFLVVAANEVKIPPNKWPRLWQTLFGSFIHIANKRVTQLVKV